MLVADDKRQTNLPELVSIVIVTCGVKDYFLSCLESVQRQRYSLVEVFLIDNSMRLSVSSHTLERYPAVQIISTGQNLGYCASLNLGIAHSRGGYVLCLNDDVQLDSSFLAEALHGFKIAHDIGMITGKILRPDRRTIDSAGMDMTLWCTPRERGYGQRDRGQFDLPGNVFAVNCAAALFRRTMLDAVRNGADWFDPDFRIFFEDLDISWRGRWCGWRAYYVPGAVAYHVRGGTVRQATKGVHPLARRYLSDDLNVLLLRNRYLVLIKNVNLWYLFLCVIPFISYEILVWGYVVLLRQNVFMMFWSDLSFFHRAWRHRSSWKIGCKQGLK
ncbi:MAG: glycosyltransferase [Candidatus Omnitrophota bacterium]